jgi:hypothetical protein
MISITVSLGIGRQTDLISTCSTLAYFRSRKVVSIFFYLYPRQGSRIDMLR